MRFRQQNTAPDNRCGFFVNQSLSDVNSNLTNLATVEYGGAEVKIGENLYKKSFIYDGNPNGTWVTVGNTPSDSKKARIDYGNSYCYYPSENMIYSIESGAVECFCRIENIDGNARVQFYCKNSMTVRAVISIAYNK